MDTPATPRRFVLDVLPEYGDSRLSNVFWIKIDEQEDGCWAWTGQCDRHGYGVNPAHLEPVTPGDNNRRKVINDSCPKDHPYAGENLLVDRSGKRRCRQCQRDGVRAFRAKNKTN